MVRNFEILNWYIIIDEDLYWVGYFRTDGNVIGCDIHPNYRRRGYVELYQRFTKNI